MEAKKPAYRRQHWLVDRKLQFPFVRMVLIAIGAAAVSALLAVRVATMLTLRAFELVDDMLIRSLFNTAFWIIVLEWVALVPIGMWIGIRMTHRVAGPLVRVRAALRKMTAGDYNVNISLRKGDLLTELADEINALATALRNRKA